VSRTLINDQGVTPFLYKGVTPFLYIFIFSSPPTNRPHKSFLIPLLTENTCCGNRQKKPAGTFTSAKSDICYGSLISLTVSGRGKGIFHEDLGHFSKETVSFSPSRRASGITRHVGSFNPRQERIRKTSRNTPVAWKAEGPVSATRGSRKGDDEKRLQASEPSTQRACYWKQQARGICGCLRGSNRTTSQERM
jgi:hypothetical protein